MLEELPLPGWISDSLSRTRLSGRDCRTNASAEPTRSPLCSSRGQPVCLSLSLMYSHTRAHAPDFLLLLLYVTPVHINNINSSGTTAPEECSVKNKPDFQSCTEVIRRSNVMKSIDSELYRLGRCNSGK